MFVKSALSKQLVLNDDDNDIFCCCCCIFNKIQATSKVEIDPEAVEKLKVTMSDFRHALANDVKPVRRSNC